jgi:ABC-2 type transport system permease protein
LKKYLSLANRSMQNAMAYRTPFILNMCASLFFMLANYFLWKAIFSQHPTLNGYAWNDLKAYLLLSLVSNTIMSYYSESRISSAIINGDVVMDLLKPLDFQKARFAETAGVSVFEGLVSAVLTGFVIWISAGIATPATGLAWILFVVSFLLAQVLKFCIMYLFSLLCFWTTNSMGIQLARGTISNLLSGALVPLTFFPDILEKICLVLPFQGMLHTPALIYLNKMDLSASLLAILVQLLWIVGLWYAGKWMWRSAVKQVTVFGG